MKIKAGTALNVGLSFERDGSIKVGRLALDGEVAVLEYAGEFIDSGLNLNPVLGAPAAGLIAPKTGSNGQNNLHGFLDASLPDAWGDFLLRRTCEKQGVSYASLTLLDKLAIVGKRGAGALIYEPQTMRARARTVDLDALATAADLIIEGEETTALDELENLGGSSGGARPKILVGIDANGHLVAPGDGNLAEGYEAWLVKFRSRKNDTFEDIGRLECAYADMARDAGIEVSPTRLIPSAHGPGYFATKRFDRLDNGGRLHFVSAAGLLDIDWDTPAIDYNDLMKLTRFIVKTQEAVERVFARMAFNVLAHNRDDHGKQHGFLMDAKGAWNLAPAYDLTHSAGYREEHYLAVKGHGGDDISVNHMLALGEEHGISKGSSSVILGRVAETVSRFDEYAERYDVSASTRKEVQRSLAASLVRMTGHTASHTAIAHEESDHEMERNLSR